MKRRVFDKQSFAMNPLARYAAVVLVAVGVTGLAVGAGTPDERPPTHVEAKPAPAAAAIAGQNNRPRPAGPLSKSGHIRRGRLQPRLRDALVVFGDRLEGAGKERLILGGTLRQGGQARPAPVRVTRELGDKLNLEGGAGTQGPPLNFNGQRALKGGQPPDAADESLLETLVNDSAEHFFAGQFQGLGTRFLGFRFRLDDGADGAYAGPFYDVYQMADQVRVGGGARERVKLYYFNSDTRLLERVRYQVERGGAATAVEVVLADWRSAQGQMVPGLVTRFEDGVAVLSLRVESIGFAPLAADGLFPAADAQ